MMDRRSAGGARGFVVSATGAGDDALASEREPVASLRLPPTHAAGMPLNVVFCLDSINVGGTEMNAVRVAERLDPARFRLSVGGFRANGGLRPRFDAAGIPVYEFPVRRLHCASLIRQRMLFCPFLPPDRIVIWHERV